MFEPLFQNPSSLNWSLFSHRILELHYDCHYFFRPYEINMWNATKKNNEPQLHYHRFFTSEASKTTKKSNWMIDKNRINIQNVYTHSDCNIHFILFFFSLPNSILYDVYVSRVRI